MTLAKEGKTKTLVQWLMEQIDGEAYRAGTLSGERHPAVSSELFRMLGGRERFLSQARALEEDAVLGKSGKIRFEWRDMGGDIKKMDYSVDIMPELCRRMGIEDPRVRQIRYIETLNVWKEKADGTWLARYYEDEISKLKKGKCSATLQEEVEDGYLYRCLDEIVNLKESVEKPVFSARIFKNVALREERLTPSKIFRRKYEGKTLGVLKKYSPYYEDGMKEDELLGAHGILTYAQTLEWKGALTYMLDETMEIDTSKNRYGTILGARTLEHAVPVTLVGIKKIFVIENKANYEKMDYKEDVLYIFCHGFFSPKEVRFLKKLNEVAEHGTKFYHWGDLDYGGIRIFNFNKANVFPLLEHYKMGRKDYEAAIAAGAGVPIESGKREKLRQLDAGDLAELKECILEHGLEVEQELLV